MKKTIRQREKTARKIKKGTRASPGTRSSKGPIAKTARPKVSMKRSEKSAPEQTLDSREQSELFEKAIALFHERNFRKAKALFEKAGAGPVLEVAHSARTRNAVSRNARRNSACNGRSLAFAATKAARSSWPVAVAVRRIPWPKSDRPGQRKVNSS